MPSKLLPILVIVTVALAGIVVGVVFLSSEPPALDPAEQPEEMLAEQQPTDDPPVDSSVEQASDQTIVDDGQTMWVSPTAGEPIPLSYIPTGTQLLLHLRPVEILAHAEGEKIVAALGPWGTDAIEQLQVATGVQLAQVSALTIAVHPTISGELHTTWRLELTEPLPSQKQALPESSERSCFVPSEGNEQILVYCHPDDATELMEQGDEPALFPARHAATAATAPIDCARPHWWCPPSSSR